MDRTRFVMVALAALAALGGFALAHAMDGQPAPPAGMAVGTSLPPPDTTMTASMGAMPPAGANLPTVTLLASPAPAQLPANPGPAVSVLTATQAR